MNAKRRLSKKLFLLCLLLASISNTSFAAAAEGESSPSRAEDALASPSQSDPGDTELLEYFQFNNKNTILILKESDQSYFRKLPLNHATLLSDSLWSSSLEKKIKKDLSFYKVISSDIDETVSSRALKTVFKLIESEKPKVVVIALGENDGLYSKDIDDIKLYLSAIIKLARNHHAKVVLVGNKLPLHYGQQYTNAFVQMYSQLAKSHDIAYVPEDKIAYSYPLFFSAYSTENTSSKDYSDKIWQALEKLIAKDKANTLGTLPYFYHLPNLETSYSLLFQ